MASGGLAGRSGFRQQRNRKFDSTFDGINSNPYRVLYQTA